MPEVRADLFCRVEAFEGAELYLRAPIQNNVDDPDGLRLDAEIDGTAGAMAVPTSLVRQRSGRKVYIDGVLVPQLVRCRVTRRRDANLQDWELTVPIQEGVTGYAGIYLGRGSNLRKRRIDIVGVYATSTGVHEIALITNGIAHEDAREHADGAFITFTGVDGGGRFDKEVIDLVIPPGSGLPRHRVIEIAARRGGVENISLDPSPTAMNHELQITNGNFIPACQEMADVEGRTIQWDRQDNLIWRRYGSTSLLPSRPVWAFTERNFVKGTCRLTQPGELLTEVTVEGDEQVLSGPCGDVTTRVTITTRGLTGPIAPAFAQSTGSSYAPNVGPAQPTEPITIRVETFDTTRRCGVVVYERRTLDEFYNPEADRYSWNAAGDAWVTLGSVYTNDDTDDESPAYAYSVERWTRTEIDETWHYWMRQNFEGPESITGLPNSVGVGFSLAYPVGWDGELNGQGWYGLYDPVKFDGIKIGTDKLEYRIFGVREYVKTRNVVTYPLPTWEVTEPANGWTVLGSKEAIVGGIESLQKFSRTVTIFGTDGRGYQTDDIEHRFGMLALTGLPYLYGDDTERASETETFRYVGSTYTKYVGTGEQTHDEIETQTGWDDRTVQTVATTGIESYLPASDRIPDSGPPTDTDVYTDTDERDELYSRAYRTESRPISVTVTDDELEANATRNVQVVHSQYLENEDEADWLARYLIEEAAAGIFDADLAGANFFIEPGDECSSITYRKLGLTGCPARVEEVTFDWVADQVENTKVSFLLYP